jgi:hypothetical protein
VRSTISLPVNNQLVRSTISLPVNNWSSGCQQQLVRSTISLPVNNWLPVKWLPATIGELVATIITSELVVARVKLVQQVQVLWQAGVFVIHSVNLARAIGVTIHSVSEPGCCNPF